MRRRPGHHPEESDTTDEVTGTDATMDEADPGSAGNGADPWGADFTGGFPRPMEDEPDQPDDIVPDRIEQFPGVVEDDRELTAQPSERQEFDASDLP